jgi:hypothetical protein
MEKIAYIILIPVVLAFLIGIIVGLISVFPEGIIGLLVTIGIGLLFIKVLRERLSNKEDDYYSKNVKK